MLVANNHADLSLKDFLCASAGQPHLFIEGDALESLRRFPAHSVDMVLTSPPYWQQREYAHTHSAGSELTFSAYLDALLLVFAEAKRVLKPEGSLWLNLGDVYDNKNLCGVPWRVAIALQDRQNWILRNEVIWNKVKGSPDNAKDKLRNLHETVFHFVKQKNYYYDIDAVRNNPGTSSIRNGSVVTATGVSGVNYRRQIQRSTALTEAQKTDALNALEATLQKVTAGELFDFRMVIRGQQRTTHSGSTKVSGRASELEAKGYYILPYDKRGSKPGDVWDIIPEDEWRKDAHYAPFPEELCIMPIKLTCPEDGIVLDPFAGTGTAIVTAVNLKRRGIGIDISREYLQAAQQRLSDRQPLLLLEEQAAYGVP